MLTATGALHEEGGARRRFSRLAPPGAFAKLTIAFQLLLNFRQILVVDPLEPSHAGQRT